LHQVTAAFPGADAAADITGHMTSPTIIVASINGTPGLGFVEVIERDDGTADRTGMLKLTPPNAQRLQAMLDRNEALVYSGPVFFDGRWCSQTFSIVATSVVIAPDEPTVVHIAEAKIEDSASVAA
jgi:hypothetical protein